MRGRAARRRHPGIGEVTSAIIIVAAFATVTILLIGTYQERVINESGAIRQMFDNQRLKAEEIMSTSVAQCVGGSGGTMSFLLHNYGFSEINAANLEFWQVDAGGMPAEANADVKHLNGTAATVIAEGVTVFVEAAPFDCANRMFIITEAQDYMVVEP